jgi:parallel beta-helix repeat protein
MKRTVALVIVILASLFITVGLFINNSNNELNSSTPNRPSVDDGTKIQTQIPSVAQPTVDFSTPTSPPPGSIVVPDDFGTIHAAVANASDGQAIYVRTGFYNECIIIDKSVWLIGENNTVIDFGSRYPDLSITHDNVNVTGFTLQNSPTPETGTFLEHMQGIGLSTQREDIQIKNARFCNIYNNNLTNSLAAVMLVNSSQNTIINNNMVDNGKGVDIDGSTNNRIQNNNIKGGGTLISLENGASANGILDNVLTDGNVGIWFDYAFGNTLSNNALTHNLYSFGIFGAAAPSDYINFVDTSNTIDGKPIYYLVSESNVAVPSDAGAVVLVNCVNVSVENTVLPMGWNEITLVNTTYSTVNANRVAMADPAQLQAQQTLQRPIHIALYLCSNNQITNNQATILLNSSSGISATGNTGHFYLLHSDSNKILSNNIIAPYFDVFYGGGVTLEASSNNLVKQNYISGSGAGITIENGASNNLVVENDIVGCTGGIFICSNTLGSFVPPTNSDTTVTSFNTVYGNNITRNMNAGLFDCGYYTQIIGNTFKNNSNCGLHLSNSQNANVVGNVIDGIFFGEGGNATKNAQIIANNITINSKFGDFSVWFLGAYPATFYHNNFFGPFSFSHYENTFQNSSLAIAPNCTWNDGRLGNYWSNYTGSDDNGDGVGDIAYSIGFGYYDDYPLRVPYDISQAIPAAPTIAIFGLLDAG